MTDADRPMTAKEADDLQAVVDTLIPGREFHLIAHDWGAIQSWESVTGEPLQNRIRSYTSISGPSLDHAGHWVQRRLRAGTAEGYSAVARQLAVLNTNTRYLDLGRQRYLRRLCATLPEPLSVCYLVCSGSEANELALRLARAHSGRRGRRRGQGAGGRHAGAGDAGLPEKLTTIHSSSSPFGSPHLPDTVRNLARG